VIEGDLDDQLGAQLDPFQVLLALPAAGVAVAAGAGLIRRQPVDERAFLGRPQARGVPDDMQLPGGVIQAEDQRADRPLLLAGPVADHDGVDRAHALDLDHPGALARPVGGVAVLGHHPLAMGEPRLGLVWIQGHRGQPDSDRRQLLEALATLRVGQLEQALILDRQHVKGDVVGRGLLGEHRDPRGGRMDALLQGAEVLLAVSGIDDDLAVDHVAPGGKAQLGEVAPERL